MENSSDIRHQYLTTIAKLLRYYYSSKLFWLYVETFYGFSDLDVRYLK